MPMYQYVCPSCGHRFEEWQKMSDDPLDTCPVCGQHIHRVIYPVGLVFKGSGFYSTDNRNGSNSAASPAANDHASADGETQPAASTSGDSKTGASETTKSDKKAEATASAAVTSKSIAAAAGE